MLGGWFGGRSALGASYEVGEEDASYHVAAASDNDLATQHWHLVRATKKADGSRASIFRLPKTKETTTSVKVESATRCFQATKQLMMPHILKFEDGSCEGDEIALGTERVQPLFEWVKAEANDPRNTQWGAYCVLKALSTLHGAQKCHGNLTPRSIFVNGAGDWKLWSLELCTPLQPDVNDASLAFFRAHEHRVNDAYRSPERKARDWDVMAEAKVGACDVWALAKLFEFAFGDALPRELAVWTKRMLHEDPKKRPTADQILRGCPLFRQGFVKELVSLNELSATSMEDQVKFYETLVDMTKRDVDGVETVGALDEVLWRGACVDKLLPRVVATLDISLAPSVEADVRRKVIQSSLPLVVQIIPMLLVDDPKMEEPFSKAKLVAVLEQALVVKDSGVRFAALSRMASLEPLLTGDFVNRKLFDAALLGFADENDDHRLQTLMAMLVMNKKLNDKNRNDRLLRVVKRLESDRSTKIRTNVVIFYGKMVPDLNDQLRLKVALPAFLKALDDQSTYVRLAAVRALGACREHFSALVAAKAVIPKVAPLLLDASSNVRDAASPCVDAFLSLARSEAEHMTKREEQAKLKAAADAATKASSSSETTSGSAQNAAASSSSSATTKKDARSALDQAASSAGENIAAAAGGWASWALNKVVATAKDAVDLERRDSAPAPPEAAPPPKLPTPNAATPPKAATPKKPEPPEGDDSGGGWGDDLDLDDAPATQKPKPADGWGDDGWGDVDDDDDVAPTPVPAKKSTTATTKARLGGATTTQKATSKPAQKQSDGWGDGGGWGDVDDDPVPAKAQKQSDGWGDDSWNDDEPPQPPPKADPKAAARAEREKKMAARRAEMEARRQQRAAEKEKTTPMAAKAAVPTAAKPDTDDFFSNFGKPPPKPAAKPPATKVPTPVSSPASHKPPAPATATHKPPAPATASHKPPAPAPAKGPQTLSLKGRSTRGAKKKTSSVMKLDMDENESWDDF